MRALERAQLPPSAGVTSCSTSPFRFLFANEHCWTGFSTLLLREFLRRIIIDGIALFPMYGRGEIAGLGDIAMGEVIGAPYGRECWLVAHYSLAS